MKIAALIARILLGLMFVFSGLNGFLKFIPAPPIPGVAGQFMGAMSASHYDYAVSAVELAGGLLLLVGRYIPLGLTLLGPILVNILLFHLFMQRQGLATALVVALLWCIVFASVRRAFSGIFSAGA